MAVFSIVKLSELDKTKRIDPEYYDPEALFIISKIVENGFKYIGKEFNVSKLAGFEFTKYFTIENMASSNNYIALTSRNIQSEILELHEFITIDRNIADKYLSRSKLFINDVILSYTGEYRRSLVLQENGFQLGPNVCRLRPKGGEINSFYLSAFLNSKIGQKLLNREKTLSAQPTVAMSRIRQIKIPKFSLEFQNKIKSLIEKMHFLIKFSRTTYSQAENLLLEELGLKDFKPKYEKTYTANLSNAFSAHRIDAEYFQPAYELVVEKIKEYPNSFSKLLKHIENIKPDFDPTKYPYKIFSYVELADIDSSIGVIHSVNEMKGKMRRAEQEEY